LSKFCFGFLSFFCSFSSEFDEAERFVVVMGIFAAHKFLLLTSCIILTYGMAAALLTYYYHDQFHYFAFVHFQHQLLTADQSFFGESVSLLQLKDLFSS
jgi:hypothetical protein